MELLTEKYRPTSINDLVSINDTFKKRLNTWKEEGQISGHLLFYGEAGRGKSSAIRVILNETNTTDFIIINGSDKTGVDDIRRVIDYVSVPPITGIKVVVIEEFERLSPSAQDSLKYVLEQYSEWCRFIFTTNNINKVTPPIISRCELYHFDTLNQEEFVKRIVSILTKENVLFELNDLTYYITKTYPDMRKCINSISQNIVDNKLILNIQDDNALLDKFNVMLEFIKSNMSILDVQKSIASSFNDNDYQYAYKFLCENIDKLNLSNVGYGYTVVAKYLYQNSTVAFKDINLVSCIVELRDSKQ